MTISFLLLEKDFPYTAIQAVTLRDLSRDEDATDNITMKYCRFVYPQNDLPINNNFCDTLFNISIGEFNSGRR